MFMTKEFPVSSPGSEATVATPRLELKGIAKRLGQTRAVDGIDLKIRAGESVVLLGPSGCGKSTTLRMIAGFLQPDEGEIVLDGAVVADSRRQWPPERRHLGMMFQNYAVWPHKSVFENVAYGLRIAKRPKDEIRRRVETMLETVELGGFGARRPSELSGGQQQRVALARSLVTEPTLLLLDEPLSNLDASLRQTMRFELKAIQQRLGVSTLYVTHDQEEALVLADRIVVMDRGRIEQIGRPEDIYRRPASRFVASFVGAANILDATVLGVSTSDRKARIRLDVGPEFVVSFQEGGVAAPVEGTKRSVVLRPEEIAVVDIAGNSSVASVEAEHFLGNRFELQLAAGGVKFRADAKAQSRGQPVAFAVADGAGWLLP